MHVGLVVLVKRMSVLINFLLQNTKLVSVLGKNLPKFCWSCLTGLTQVANSDDMRLEIQIGAKKMSGRFKHVDGDSNSPPLLKVMIVFTHVRNTGSGEPLV